MGVCGLGPLIISGVDVSANQLVALSASSFNNHMYSRSYREGEVLERNGFYIGAYRLRH